jgi:hypothetical protein
VTRGAGLLAWVGFFDLFPGFICTYLHGKNGPKTTLDDEKCGAKPMTRAGFLWQSAAAAFHQGRREKCN